jgi:hypothetical protein
MSSFWPRTKASRVMNERMDQLRSELELASNRQTEYLERLANAEKLSVIAAEEMLNMRVLLKEFSLELENLRSASAQAVERAIILESQIGDYKTLQVQLSEVRTSIVFLEKRVNEEAEQARRGVSALYERLRTQKKDTVE